jgi:hypothetical protein
MSRVRMFSIQAGVGALMVAGLTLSATVVQAQAQADRVTVMLRSGEKVAGQLEDLANNTLFVRVSRDDQRRLPIGEVAVIDFVGGASGLPETELGQARGDNHLLVLRNSQLVQGRLVDIDGGAGSAKPDDPRMFVFRTTAGEERRVPAREVGRVYVGRYPLPAGGDTTAAQAGDPSRIRVQANQQWVNTNIQVAQGQQVMFEATGEVRLSNDAEDIARPAGSVKGRNATGSPMPGQLAGALIGRVGPNGTPFAIGDQKGPLPMPAPGQLFLGINDDNVGDNQGEYTVVVKPQPVQMPTTTRRPR